MPLTTKTHSPVWPLVIGVSALLLAFTYWVIQPTLGFDDANITMNYAENIAAGHGYVYYVGGEWVEGSTSPLWTAINVLGYLLPVSIWVWLTGLGVAITLGVVAMTLGLTRQLADISGQDPVWSMGLAACAFLYFPGLITWLAWSFMDIGLWVLIVAGFLSLGLRILTQDGPAPVRGFATLGALAVLTRPEGIAVAVGFGIILLLTGRALGRARVQRPARTAIGVALVAFAALLSVRYAVFGVLQPNTFYAKVSVSYGAQALQGLDYLGRFLMEPANLGLCLLVLLAPVLAFGKEGPARPVWAMLVAFILAGMAVYVALGGDHFGSFRFFTVLMPPMIALAGVAGAAASGRILARSGPALMVVGLGLAVLLGVTSVKFYQLQGLLIYENHLANRNRELGVTLNDVPGRPSIAVIPAGGVSLTYEGVIYDLMGLNWSKMAHADRDFSGIAKNHGGFSRDVFYETMPELVDPILLDCDRTFYLSSDWRNTLLKGLYDDAAFQEAYAFACHGGAAFYIRRDFAERHGLPLAES